MHFYLKVNIFYFVFCRCPINEILRNLYYISEEIFLFWWSRCNTNYHHDIYNATTHRSSIMMLLFSGCSPPETVVNTISLGIFRKCRWLLCFWTSGWQNKHVLKTSVYDCWHVLFNFFQIFLSTPSLTQVQKWRFDIGNNEYMFPRNFFQKLLSLDICVYISESPGDGQNFRKFRVRLNMVL